jgi:hypothetical protein
MRTLFYLELSLIGEVPVFLNPSKDQFVREYQMRFKPEALRLVQSVADEKIQKAIEEILQITHQLAIPSSTKYIIRNAYAKGISIIDSVVDIRESEAAKEFRKWLFQLQCKLCGDTPELLAAARMLKDLQKHADKWADSLDPLEGVVYEKKRLQLEAMPVIGWIFKMAGMKGPEVKDPIIHRRPFYLTFISSWYQEMPEKKDESPK